MTVHSVLKLLMRAAAERHPEVVSMRLGGSGGRGEVDEWSDSDVFVTISADRMDNFLDSGARSLLQELGEPKVFRGPVLVLGFGHCFTAFIPPYGICQIAASSESALSPHFMQRDQAGLQFDHSGRATEIASRCRALAVPWDEIAASACTLGWFRVHSALKETARGSALQSQKYLREALEQVVVMWRCEARSTPRGLNFREPMRGLEQELPERAADCLHINSLVAETRTVEAAHLLAAALRHSHHQMKMAEVQIETFDYLEGVIDGFAT